PPDNEMAYRLRARFTQDDPQLRVGLKVTAKLYGKRTVLFDYLLRKPQASLRVWLGVSRCPEARRQPLGLARYAMN
ncbi:hypothetical protein H4F55_22420, partial [Pectobacterium brasiliense]|nr:hypothetical protein [Pectobacterium brasiliense]